MPTLKDVAQRSKVSLVTAFNALSGVESVDPETHAQVVEAATALGYRLNITIRDVATLAEVSTATVSYVLNNSQPVSPATRDRVLHAVRALGYHPNSTARNLQSSKSRLLGYPWYDLPPGQINAVLDRFTYAAAREVEARGYHLLTFAQPSVNSIAPFDELIKTNRVDGFLLCFTNHNDERIEYLMAMKIPFVAFGRANETWDFPYVDVDGGRGVEMMTEHLLSNGHTRIGVVGWPDGSLSGDARLQGYMRAMHAVHLPVQPEWIVRSTNTAESAYKVAHNLTDLPTHLRPTAIVCMSDIMALGVMNWLTHVGLEVGTDIAVTGFDDDPTSSFLRPPLSSVCQPIAELAAQSVQMLMTLLDGEPLRNRHTLLSPTLAIRDSSRKKAPAHSRK